MYYYRENGNYIEKYEITYNKEELLKIKDEIENKYTKTVHKKETTDTNIHFHNRKVSNMKYRYDGYKESFGTRIKVYEYEYDEIITPRIVNLIEYLSANDDIATLKEILTYNEEDEICKLDKSIKEKFELLDTISDIEEQKKTISEIESMIEEQKKIAEMETINTYISKIRELIKIKLVDTLSIEMYYKVFSFFDETPNVFVDKEDIVNMQIKNM